LEEETETGLEVLAVLGTVGMLGIEGIVGTGFDDLPASLPARKEGFGGGTFECVPIFERSGGVGFSVYHKTKNLYDEQGE
jgi:hypothetical protein